MDPTSKYNYVYSELSLQASPMDRMKSLIILYAIVFVSVSGLKQTIIDWKAEIIRENTRYLEEYGAYEIDKIEYGHFAEGFVYISHDSINLGDFKELGKVQGKLRERGHLVLGLPNIVATCGNTAFKWNTLVFTNDKNFTRQIHETVMFQYVEGQLKIILYQSVMPLNP